RCVGREAPLPVPAEELSPRSGAVGKNLPAILVGDDHTIAATLDGDARLAVGPGALALGVDLAAVEEDAGLVILSDDADFELVDARGGFRTHAARALPVRLG